MPEIRRATEADLAAIAAIHVASWQAAHRGILSDSILDGLTSADRLVSWRRWCRQPRSEIYLAIQSGQRVAFCRFLLAPRNAGTPADFADVTHLYGMPSYIGKGVGRSLFAYVVSKARARSFDHLLLWVLEENKRARRFYERFGFTFDGARQTRPEWLGEGVQEVRYQLALMPTAAQQGLEPGVE